MTEADLGRLLSALRVLPPIGALLLLAEWVAGLALVPLVFCWGIPVIHREIELPEPAATSGRTETSSVVVVPRDSGSWLFRAPFHLFRVSTPFPVHGLAEQAVGHLRIVGRHPVGGLLFLVGAIGNTLVAELAPLLVRSLAEQGFRVEWSRVWVYLAFGLVFYGGSLWLERGRFLKAVADLVPVLTATPAALMAPENNEMQRTKSAPARNRGLRR